MSSRLAVAAVIAFCVAVVVASGVAVVIALVPTGGSSSGQAEQAGVPTALPETLSSEGQEALTSLIPTQPQATGAAAGGLGDPVRVGMLEMTIDRTERARELKAPISGTAKAPTGEYVLVHIRVANRGAAAAPVLAGWQFLIDGAGKSHRFDSAGAAHMGGPAITLRMVDSGAELVGVLVYDVPVGTVVAGLELHENIGSPAVRVDIV